MLGGLLSRATLVFRLSLRRVFSVANGLHSSFTPVPVMTIRLSARMKVPVFGDAVIDLNAPAWKDRVLYGCESATRHAFAMGN